MLVVTWSYACGQWMAYLLKLILGEETVPAPFSQSPTLSFWWLLRGWTLSRFPTSFVTMLRVHPGPQLYQGSPRANLAEDPTSSQALAPSFTSEAVAIFLFSSYNYSCHFYYALVFFFYPCPFFYIFGLVWHFIIDWVFLLCFPSTKMLSISFVVSDFYSPIIKFWNVSSVLGPEWGEAVGTKCNGAPKNSTIWMNNILRQDF